jgi:hypothetical protein
MRAAGKNARLYAAILSTGAAELIPYCQKWSVDFTTDFVDLTVNGDSNRVYGSSAPQITGTYTGFLDTATAQLYTAAQDGLSRRWYLYGSTPSSSGAYWFGTAVFDWKTDADVGGPCKMDGHWWAQDFWSKDVAGVLSSGFTSGFDAGFF